MSLLLLLRNANIFIATLLQQTTVDIVATGQVGVNSSATRSTTATITATGQVGVSSDASEAITATIVADGRQDTTGSVSRAFSCLIEATGELAFPVYFQTPTHRENESPLGRGGTLGMFGRTRWNQRGTCVVQNQDGSYTQTLTGEDERIAVSRHTYLGGRKYHITPVERDDLVAAGYGSFITVEP
jgi:hypothetical protein